MISRIWNSIVNNRIIWAIVSIIVAIGLWNYIVHDVNPTRSLKMYFTVEYKGEDVIFSRNNLKLSSDAPSQVYMKVSGTYSDITKIRNNSPTITVDLSNYTAAGEYKVTYTPSYPAGLISQSTLDIIPENGEGYYLTIKIEEWKEKTFDIEYNSAIEFKCEDGYEFDSADLTLSDDTVKVNGPAEIIDSIDHAQVAYYEITDPLTKTETYDRPIEFILTNGQKLDDALVSELNLDMDTVVITIPISKVKEVKLAAEFEYGGGATESNIDYKINPETVNIKGDAETIDKIDSITLGKIDLATYAENEFSETFDIPLQEGVSLSETQDSKATVYVEISNVVTRDITINNANISVTSVPEGYAYEVTTNELTVTIRGPENLLEDLQPENVWAVADLTDITTVGSVAVPVKISISGEKYEGVGAIKKEANKITVVLSKE